jgi:hypothetical protein
VSPDFEDVLQWEPLVVMYVDFETDGRQVVSYSVVLAAMEDGTLQTVRVYDAAHGVNERHRHTKTGGKQPAEIVHGGTLGEGMRTAIAQVRENYLEMIEGWHR